MNRNDERIGVQTVSPREAFNREREEVISKPEPKKERIQAPPLTYLNPTQVIDLPSKGRHYEESHPLYGKDKLEIKQMTTIEENIMLNKSLQREGEAADKLFQSLLVDKSIDTRSMLSCDRESIIVHSRIYSQGKNYPTTVVCPSCFAKIHGQLDLYKAIDIGLERLNQIGEVEKEFGIEWTGPRTYKMKLETTGWTVECKLLNGHDEKIQFEQEKKLEMLKKKDSKHPMVLEANEKSRLLRSLIVSIDGNDGAGPRKDRREINQAIDSMPSIDNRAITEVYKLINPRIALMKNIYCDKCAYEGVIEVPVGPDFFSVI